MTAIRPTTHERIGAASATLLLVAAVGYAFIAGLAMHFPVVVSEAITVFDIPPKPPPQPEKIDRNPVHHKKRAGAAAPPNLKSRPTELVAPPPLIRTVPPPPVVVALTPGTGTDASIGNAARRGPGPGSGGMGRGTGSGGQGDGDGGGGFTAPRRISGRLKDSDYHRPAGDPGIERTVSVLFVVAPTGRVSDCRITRSSGDATLDETTCRLIERRFRFDPSRDAQGRPVEAMVEENHSWSVQ